MKTRLTLLAGTFLVFLTGVTCLEANSRAMDFVHRRVDGLEKKRYEKHRWSQRQGNSMTNKTFPIQEWDKHFSSVGSKRAPISVKDGQEKQMFRTEMLERKEFDVEMSRWNERMADLHKKAGIEMDQRAQLIADQQAYGMMLQNTQQFSEMGDQVSLRDLNRYQFRRNRSDDGVPVERAGSGR